MEHKLRSSTIFTSLLLRMKTEATLKKISEALHISISTVSRALKNHPDIAEHTKKRVQELAATLEYEPNTYAINLRNHHSKLFGVILPTLSNNFYQAFIATLEEDARKNGYSLLIVQSCDDPQVELQSLKLFRANKVAGVFVCLSPNSADTTAFLKMEDLDTPVIFFDKVPPINSCNKVCVADIAAAQLAANCLIEKGYQHILALFGNAKMSITHKRLQAFEEAFATATSAARLYIEFAHSSDESMLITQKCLDTSRSIDAIFCMSDEVLIGAMKTLQQNNIAIPSQIGVIAISNGFIPQLFHPNICYIETSGAKLASLAFQRMMACLAGSTFIQELTVDAMYVKGNSI